MQEETIKILAQPDTQEKSSDVRGSTIKKLQNLVEQDLKKEIALEEGKGQEKNYDQDGFKIPVGKIPLDGQFSTQEVKELIALSKEEGVLKSDIGTRVADKNSVCNHLEIVEPKTEIA